MNAFNFNKIFFVFLILGLGAIPAKATSITVSGFVFSDTTWNVDTVNVVGNMTIQDGATITIAPGCRVQMHGFYAWNVMGAIKAQGTAQDSIFFTSADTTDFWTYSLDSGGWKGMYIGWIDTLNDSTIFDYCVFEFVKKGNGLAAADAALHIDFTDRVRVSNSCIRDNYNTIGCPGVKIRGASPIIINNLFRNNIGDIGGSMVLLLEAAPIIHNNVFYKNFADRNGGAISMQSSSPTITNNSFFNNQIKLANCGPADGGGAIRCTNASNPYIANNVFANNDAGAKGGAIECMYDSNPIIENNTIANNNGDNAGGGLYCRESNPLVRNNIFWGNTRFDGVFLNQVQLATDDSDPDISFTCMQDSANFMLGSGHAYTGNYTDNISNDPLFVSPSSGAGVSHDGMAADWTLQSASPCIDQGTTATEAGLPANDLWGNIRYSGQSIDMGAFEFYKGAPTSINEQEIQELLIYPNPTNGSFKVLNTTANKLIKIYSLDGKLVMSSDKTEITLPKGVYVVVSEKKRSKVIVY